MKKRNIFAKNEKSSFLDLVNLITESMDNETEGLDFDDEAGDDAEMDDFDAESDDFDTESDDFDSEDTVTVDLPRSLAQQLFDVLGAILEGEDSMDGELNDDELGDDELSDDEFGDDELGDDEIADQDDEDMDVADDEAEECKAKLKDEDEEVLGSNQSNVAQSTISRNGAPKRSKANTSWNTGKTVKSVFDQTVSGEGEPAGTSRDGAPKRSKFSKGWNNSKTVSSRLQPGKHIMEIGK